jgi:hypothetical protein
MPTGGSSVGCADRLSVRPGMRSTPPETHFKHHGVVAETREQWRAREAAAQASQARASTPHRAAEETARQGAQDASRRPLGSRAEDASKRRRYASVRTGLMAAVGLGGLAALIFTITSSPTTAAPAGEFDDPREANEPEVHERPAKRVSPSESHTASSLRSTAAGAAGSGQRRIERPPPRWADAPTVGPAPGGWWCICYETARGTPNTACRRSPGECEALRGRIQKRGTSSIRRGSATPGRCRHVQARYPWSEVGHSERWAESAYSDAIQAVGICAL